MTERSNKQSWRLALILLLGLALRLFVSGSQPPQAILTSGGDAMWYMLNGYGYFSSTMTGEAYGMRYAVSNLPTAPLYIIVAGLVQRVAGLEGGVRLLWLLQSLLGTLSCYLAYRIAYALRGDHRVGFVAAAALSFSPAFILEASHILSESLYIFFLLAGFWLYCDYLATDDRRPRLLMVALTGAVFGLATLTRAITLLFPVGLAALLLLNQRQHAGYRVYWTVTVLLISYGAVISTWTLHNVWLYERFVIGSDQFTAALWRGASPDDGSPQENDALLDGQSPAQQARDIIYADIGAYVLRRVTELIHAYAQPYGTVQFGDESLRVLAEDWLQAGFSLSSLQRLVVGEGFLPKVLIYIWHYVALILGSIGMLLMWRQWQRAWALMGFIAYTTLVHLILLALPRYIFPTYPFWWVFASITLVALWDYTMTRRSPPAE